MTNNNADVEFNPEEREREFWHWVKQQSNERPEKVAKKRFTNELTHETLKSFYEAYIVKTVVAFLSRRIFQKNVLYDATSKEIEMRRQQKM